MKRRFVFTACAAAVVFSFGVAQASQYRDAPTPVGIKVSQPGTAGKVIESCLLAAALRAALAAQWAWREAA